MIVERVDLNTVVASVDRLKATIGSVVDITAEAMEHVARTRALLDATKVRVAAVDLTRLVEPLPAPLPPIPAIVVAQVAVPVFPMDVVAHLLMDAHRALPEGETVVRTLIEMACLEIGTKGAAVMMQDAAKAGLQ